MNESVAIYARKSSDKQSPHSVDDQVRLATEYAEHRGWRVTHIFKDDELSGRNLFRPGVQALLSGIRQRAFDLVLAESIDRLSRSQEGAPHIFERAVHADIKIYTIEEGEIDELKIGMKGTMGALQLKSIADKTRRGQRGVVERGRSAGGRSYGYDVVHEFGADGRPVRGKRTINEFEAAIVRRIFDEYLKGRSPRSIARQLNLEGVPNMRSKKGWSATSINGDRKRGIGILNNELYIGRIIWNRTRFSKSPDSGLRVWRLNPQSEWVISEKPEWRIVPQEVWDKVKEAQGRLDLAGPKFWKKQRAKSLLSHLVKCGCCGGGFSKISAKHLGCSTARNNGTCSNMLTMRVDVLEAAVIDALESRLMKPELCEAFTREYTAHMNRLRMEHNASREAHRVELERNRREVDKLLDAIAGGIDPQQVKDRINGLSARQRELQMLIEAAPDAAPLLHPSLASRYHKEIQALLETLNAPEHREESARLLRALVDRVELTPTGKELRIDLFGELAGILQIASGGEIQLAGRNTGGAPLSGDPTKNAMMVAGAGFEPATFRL